MRQVVERILALTVFVATLVYLGTYPVANIVLLFGAVLYVALLLWRTELWLVLVTALLPVLYLSPWSGRIFLDEFDALMLLTVSAVLWRQRYAVSLSAISPGTRLLLLVFIATYIAALLRGLLPLPDFDANSVANYYSRLNSPRVGKGLLWALLLYPAWVAERRISMQRVLKLLVMGLSMGALFVFLVVLWERNVLHTLAFWTNKYALIQALLDFTTSYRVTALFADMHTGGTAIDGYLLLVLPFVAIYLFIARGRVSLMVAAMLFSALVYTCVTTFSRGVYLGVGVAVVSAMFLIFQRHRRYLKSSAALLSALSSLGLVAACFVAFRSGGYVTLVYVVSAFVAAAVVVVYPIPLRRTHVLAGLTVLLVILIVLATSGISERHRAFSAFPAYFLAMACITVGAVAGLYIARLSRSLASSLQASVFILAMVIIIGLMTPSLFGYRMESRFASVKEDLWHRVEHWQTAIDVMDDGILTTLFGQGLGRFPEQYFWKHQNAKDVGGFVYQREEGNQYLRFLGSHDVRLGQRMSLRPSTDYVISLDLRTSDKQALLYIRACHRQLIHPYEWNPACVQFKQIVESTQGSWRRFELPFKSGKLGSWKSTARAPLVLTISNRREYGFNLRPQTVLDFDNVSLSDAKGVEYLSNGDFESGIDRWFAYYDFNHLPWHIKNLWVHVYFETGLVGLVLMLSLLYRALSATLKAAGTDRLAFAIFVAMAGFLAVGSFGTLLDSPRIAFLFYFLLLIGLGFGRWRVPAQRHTSGLGGGS